MPLIRCPKCNRIVSTEAPIDLHDCSPIVLRAWKKRRKKNQSSKLSERFIKKLIVLGLQFELDSSNYAIVRDDGGILLGPKHGMDYGIWRIYDISYRPVRIPKVWGANLGKFAETTIDGINPVSQLVKNNHNLEIHRRYGYCFVD